jgi:hypothetical protein
VQRLLELPGREIKVMTSVFDNLRADATETQLLGNGFRNGLTVAVGIMGYGDNGHLNPPLRIVLFLYSSIIVPRAGKIAN